MAMPTHNFHISYIQGSLEANNVYIGDYGEISIDIANNQIRAHDGVKPGGYPIESMEALNELFGKESDPTENYPDPSDPSSGGTDSAYVSCLESLFTPTGMSLGVVSPGHYQDINWCPDV